MTPDEARFRTFVQTVGRGERRAKPLNFDDAREAMGMVLDGRADPRQRSAFLLASRIKGEDPAEMAGFIAAMQDRCVRADWGEIPPHTVSIGHPYDGREDTFIMGAGAALLATAAGARVILHSGGPVPPKHATGVADVLTALNLKAFHSPEDAPAFFKARGFVHIDLRKFLHAWNEQLELREIIGLRLPFSSAEKMMDVARCGRTIVGIAHLPSVEKMTGSMRQLNIDGAIIQGLEGSCDLSPQHPTRVCRMRNGVMQETSVDPKAFSIAPALAVRDIGADPVKSAELTRKAFDGEKDELSRGAAEALALNAGVILWIADVVDELSKGVERARAALADGSARILLG